MSTLRQTQDWLVSAILADDAATDAAARVTPGARQTPGDRLGVYRHAYRARLLECLEDDFPVVFYALGRERAEELCADYMRQHPSSSFSLNVFGRHMSAFLRERGEPFAAELAALEWSVVESIHAAEAPKMEPTALAAIDPSEWGDVALVPSPSLRLHAFEYPVNAFYQSFHDEESPAVPAPSSSRVAVYRLDMKIWRMDLTRGMHGLLSALASGAPLATAFESVDGGDETDEVPDVGAWFRQWTTDGFFAGVSRKS